MPRENARPDFVSGLWGLPAHERLDSEERRAAPLVAILTAALALRLVVAWWLPSIHQADEVYQVAEQAYRSVNGYGIVSWEFQTASRPALLATAVKPIFLLPATPRAHGLLVAALFAVLSLLPVWIAFRWTTRLAGARAGLLAAALTATWFELVYFAPKPTADAVGGYLLLTGVFFGRPDAGTRGRFAGGFCLALAALVRLQILPAVLVVALVAGIAAGRRRSPALAAGALTGAVLVGIEEWIAWGAPFRGHWRYLTMELVHHASQAFGSASLLFYLKQAVLIYGGALPVMAGLALVAARRVPLLLIALVALVAPFHFVGHKEYRFMLAAVPVLAVMVSMGVVDVLARLRPGMWRPAGTTFALVVLGWLTAMLAMSLGDTFRPNWTKDRNQIRAFADVGAAPEACGVALVNLRWWHTPGYSGLGRNVPIYEIRDPAEAPRLQAAANFVLAGTKADPPPAPYVVWRGYTRPLQYLYRRPGGCVPSPGDVIMLAPLIPGVDR